MASGFTDFIIGQDPSALELKDSRYAQATQSRDVLRQQALDRLSGKTAGAGEAAINQHAQAGLSQLEAQARGSAAGARGVGRAAAQASAQQTIGQGAQAILGQAQQQAAAQKAADERAAIATLMGVEGQDVNQAQLEGQLKQQQAKPGALGFLTSLLGTGAGAVLGGPAGATTGGKLGGAFGGGLQQLLRPRG